MARKMSLSEAQARIEELEGLLETKISELRIRDDALIGVAHDLRNPLGTIGMAIEYFLEKPDSELAGMDRDILLAGRRSKDRADRLIEELLDVSRLEGGNLRVESGPLNVVHVVEDALEAVKYEFQAREQVNLEFKEARGIMLAWADRYQLKRIIVNLLTNASKFTLKGVVEVSIEQQKDNVYVRVKDTGIGIPPEHHEEIFQRYKQVNLQKSGLGFGLYLSRALAELMNGSLSVESTVGEGSTFTLTLRTTPPA